MPRSTKEKVPLRFCIVSHKEASGQPSSDLKALNKSSAIYLNKLALTEDQSAAIENLYATGQSEDIEFSADSSEDQAAATMLLANLDIDITASRTYDPTSRWSVKWTSQTNSSSSKNKRKTRRTLYQCNSGFVPSAFSSKAIREHRRFSACLSHVEITYSLENHRLLRFRGFFEHNAICDETYSAIRKSAVTDRECLWKGVESSLQLESGTSSSESME